MANLEVGCTRVTDIGLEHLRELSSLIELDLEGTQATDEGIENLREALPECVIFHGAPPFDEWP